MAECSQKEFVAKAREALGTRWVHQGRTLHGLDCIGLILWDARQFDLNHFEPPPYGRRAEWGKFVGFFRQHTTEVKLVDMQPADCLVFRQSIFPCHCGIVTEVGDDPKFIHSNATRRRVVEERYTRPWRSSTVAVFRIPGVTP